MGRRLLDMNGPLPPMFRKKKEQGPACMPFTMEQDTHIEKHMLHTCSDAVGSDLRVSGKMH